MVTIVSSAPGKVILFGEHAVVHGVAAVAAALSDLRIFVELNTSEEEEGLTIQLHDIKVANKDFSINLSWDKVLKIYKPKDISSPYSPDAETIELLKQEIQIDSDAASQGVMATTFLVVHILHDFIQSIKGVAASAVSSGSNSNSNTGKTNIPGSVKGLNIKVRSVGLPIGAGLGSSAAFSVALSSTLIRFKSYFESINNYNNNSDSANKNMNDLTKSISTINLHKWEYNLAIENSLPSFSTTTATTSTSPTTTVTAPVATTTTPATLKYTLPDSPALEIINKWAYAAEVVIHGNPSGLDNTTSCFGGALKFSKKPDSGGFHSLGTLPPVHVLLTNTKVPRRTADLVAKVGVLYSSHPSVVTPIFDSIEAITMRFLEITAAYNASTADASNISDGSDATINTNTAATIEEIENEIGTLMSVNHGLLCALGVSHPALSAVTDTARTMANLHTKLTGAGGGGCAVTLIPAALLSSPRVEALLKQLKSFGFEPAHSTLGGLGVKWHT